MDEATNETAAAPTTLEELWHALVSGPDFGGFMGVKLPTFGGEDPGTSERFGRALAWDTESVLVPSVASTFRIVSRARFALTRASSLAELREILLQVPTSSDHYADHINFAEEHGLAFNTTKGVVSLAVMPVFGGEAPGSSDDFDSALSWDDTHVLVPSNGGYRIVTRARYSGR
jgi:hypothetical protein